MALPQHSGAFFTLRLTSPVQEISYSLLNLRPHTAQWNTGKLENHSSVKFNCEKTFRLSVFSEGVIAFCASEKLR